MCIFVKTPRKQNKQTKTTTTKTKQNKTKISEIVGVKVHTATALTALDSE